MTTKPDEPNGLTLPAEPDRLGAERDELERRIVRLEFERDGYYGEWQGTKNQLRRIRRSPAWLVWLAWVLLGRILLWPFRWGIRLAGAILRMVPRALARPYLILWSWTAARSSPVPTCGRRDSTACGCPGCPTCHRRPSPGADRHALLHLAAAPRRSGPAVQPGEPASGRCAIHPADLQPRGRGRRPASAPSNPSAHGSISTIGCPNRARPVRRLEPPNALLFASDQAAAKIRDIVGRPRHPHRPAGVHRARPVSSSRCRRVLPVDPHRARCRVSVLRPPSSAAASTPVSGRPAYGTSVADWRRLLRYEVAMDRAATQVHTMSADDALFLARYLPDGAARIRVVPNGVDCDYYGHPPRPVTPRRALRGELREPPQRGRHRAPRGRRVAAGAVCVCPVPARRGRRQHVGPGAPVRRQDGISVLGEVADLRPRTTSTGSWWLRFAPGRGPASRSSRRSPPASPVVSTTLGAEGIPASTRPASPAGRHGRRLRPTGGARADRRRARRITGLRQAVELVRQHYDWSRWPIDPARLLRGAARGSPSPPTRGAGGVLEVIPTSGRTCRDRPGRLDPDPDPDGGEEMERMPGRPSAPNTPSSPPS